MLIKLHLAILTPPSLPVPFLLIQWEEKKTNLHNCVITGSAVWSVYVMLLDGFIYREIDLHESKSCTNSTLMGIIKWL